LGGYGLGWLFVISWLVLIGWSGYYYWLDSIGGVIKAEWLDIIADFVNIISCG
jgi:hypothetical protein